MRVEDGGGGGGGGGYWLLGIGGWGGACVRDGGARLRRVGCREMSSAEGGAVFHH